MKNRTRLAFIIATSLGISGCVTAPGRDEPGAFISLGKDRVPKENVAAFADCVLDGFNKAHYIITNVSARQQRRATGYRVETFSAGRILLVSVDVSDDGIVEMLEAKDAAALINTRGERSAFVACLAKHRT